MVHVATCDRIFEGQKKWFLGDTILKLEMSTSMDFEPCFKVHNLVAIPLSSTKPGQMTNFNNMVFYLMVLIYHKLDKICSSAQSPANLEMANKVPQNTAKWSLTKYRP